MPRDSHLFKECNEKIEELVLSLTLPLYFALSGLKTDVTEINTADQGAMVVLVCFIATIGKVHIGFTKRNPLYPSILMYSSLIYHGAVHWSRVRCLLRRHVHQREQRHCSTHEHQRTCRAHCTQLRYLQFSTCCFRSHQILLRSHC
jgi:hypothetical protein